MEGAEIDYNLGHRTSTFLECNYEDTKTTYLHYHFTQGTSLDVFFLNGHTSGTSEQ